MIELKYLTPTGRLGAAFLFLPHCLFAEMITPSEWENRRSCCSEFTCLPPNPSPWPDFFLLLIFDAGKAPEPLRPGPPASLLGPRGHEFPRTEPIPSGREGSTRLHLDSADAARSVSASCAMGEDEINETPCPRCAAPG